MQLTKKEKVTWFFLMHVAYLFLTAEGVLLKIATREDWIKPFSWQFFLLVFGAIVMLGMYALFWQQVLKRMSLITAYSNKPITIIWAFIVGLIVFGEQLTWNMCVGAVIVIAGIYLILIGDKKEEERLKNASVNMEGTDKAEEDNGCD